MSLMPSLPHLFDPIVNSWPDDVTMHEWFTPQETDLMTVSNEKAQGVV